ncbi:hypothetical protein JOL62DRAFT_397040 [Phyllosticta paracitricarpa]|uniref:Uncharacterized protein n=1 Tax=Phyllosticta paracitricarpa TaxID=2016321 RepID=A0ABR1MSE3_9PEZI
MQLCAAGRPAQHHDFNHCGDEEGVRPVERDGCPHSGRNVRRHSQPRNSSDHHAIMPSIHPSIHPSSLLFPISPCLAPDCHISPPPAKPQARLVSRRPARSLFAPRACAASVSTRKGGGGAGAGSAEQRIGRLSHHPLPTYLPTYLPTSVISSPVRSIEASRPSPDLKRWRQCGKRDDPGPECLSSPRVGPVPAAGPPACRNFASVPDRRRNASAPSHARSEGEKKKVGDRAGKAGARHNEQSLTAPAIATKKARATSLPRGTRTFAW